MIAIIDYGMGNLKSVYNALKKIDCDCVITKNHDEIKKADKSGENEKALRYVPTWYLL